MLQAPYLATAVFCEKVLIEKDDVASVVRIIDILRVKLTKEQAENNKLPLVRIFLLISIKASVVPAQYQLRVTPISPDGRELTKIELPVFLEREGQGANAIIEFLFEIVGQGMYWFEVFADTTMLTRMPLQVSIETEPESNSADE